MTCREVRRLLPEQLENAQESELGAHLKACPACSELVSDLQFIAREARQLAATDEPAPRLWARVAAELRAEAIIREPDAVATAPILRVRRRWSIWWLAPVAAALVAGASYLVSHQPASQVAEQKPAMVQTPATPAPAAQAPATVAQTTAPKSTASTGKRRNIEPGSSVEDQQFLSEVAQRAPSMRSTYEDQLRSVNAYIQAAQAYLDQNPDDVEARQQLMEAYQQKALLYQMALDHIQ
jgi:hypothetical protein